ncbi:hypothetical protein D8M35_04350, partial [Curtobacterium sp. HSID17257]
GSAVAGAPAGVDGDSVGIVRAEGSGDDAIVEAARSALADGHVPVVVVTADRELRTRVEALGAEVRGPGWFREQ